MTHTSGKIYVLNEFISLLYALGFQDRIFLKGISNTQYVETKRYSGTKSKRWVYRQTEKESVCWGGGGVRGAVGRGAGGCRDKIMQEL